MPETLEGLVVARAPGYFVVRSDDGATRLCVVRGRLRRARTQSLRPALSQRGRPTRPRHGADTPGEDDHEEPPTTIAVGDRVRFTPDGASGGAIEAILPRRNKLARAAAESREEQILLANLDLAVLVFAVADPIPHFGLLDRYLVITEDAGIEALICFNKIDLGISTEIADQLRIYADIGYEILLTSTVCPEGLAELDAHLRNRVALLTGPSGVGKSSLLNVIEPAAAQRVGEISLATGKGRHTTTGVRLFPLSDGGWLADSAGIRELAPWRIDEDRLAEAFVEFRPYLDHCVYDDCTHEEDAEGCAVCEAVAEGGISLSRYDSYLHLRQNISE
ncbi:MAG TPA: ribosome small subunit-dependent GTPase A [Ktedonobacterales bacterium]|nr:ribosome small subunit-dependent GTPase A [Ktedonobacterales bacterium]